MPLAIYEYFLFVFTSDRYLLGKFCLCLGSPFGIAFAANCLLFKAFTEPLVRRVVKSKMSDGRLRLSHGEERDTFEGSTLANFEDERIHKSVERYNMRAREWGRENENEEDNPTDAPDFQSEASFHSEDDVDDNNNNRLKRSPSSAGTVVTSVKKKKKQPSRYDLNMRTLMDFSKASVYTGKNARITPFSPFLQLANIGNIESVHSALTTTSAAEKRPSTTDASFLQKSHRSFKDSSEINVAQTPPESRRSNRNEDALMIDNTPADESRPELLITDGVISHYQPGLTTVAELKNFNSTANEDDFPSVRQLETSKNIYSDDADAKRILDYPSMYFLPFKFAPIFTSRERKEIFSVVIPEAFIDDFGAAVKDMESFLESLRDKLGEIDKKQDAHLPAILRKINESNDW